MHLDMNDPKSTAYALGELESAQTAELDKHVHECESCRHAVEEIRSLAATLASEMHESSAPKLHPTKRQAVEVQLKTSSRRRLMTNKLFLALAASVLVAVSIGVTLRWRAAVKNEPLATVHWQQDNVDYHPYVPQSRFEGEKAQQTPATIVDNSNSTSSKDLEWLKSLDDKSGQEGRPGNVTGGPMVTSSESTSTPRPIPTQGVMSGKDRFHTGDDNAPRAPLGETARTPTAQDKFRNPKSDNLQGSAGNRPAAFGPARKRQPQAPVDNSTPESSIPVVTSKPPVSEPNYTIKKPSFESKTHTAAVPGDKPASQSTTSPTMQSNGLGVKPAEPMQSKRGPSIFDLGPKKDRLSSHAPELTNPNDPQKPVVNDPFVMPPAKDWAALNDGRRAPNASPGGGPQAPEAPRAAHDGELLSNEAYAPVVDNPFLPALQNPLSTFSIDVDTASYANVRRMLSAGQRPPKDAVRIEEMVNYFSYDYAPPKDDKPFSAHVEMADCPWHGEHRLVRIGLKGKDLMGERRPACNLVFLLDVSGSMNAHNKLPLVKESMRLLLNKLNEEDNVAIVVYAGASGLALPTTSCEQKLKILAAIDNLQAGGSTNGGAGIQLAYDTAAANFIRGGVNRVILCTDGDFNVGITSRDALTNLIQEKAKGGVFLSVLGFGMGNLKDDTLEKLADMGNGNYAYIDSREEAHKVLVRQLDGTLVTIAKDVKIQVEFNPAVVSQYRLIGYENRMLKAADFNNDKKDAGEIGAGHTVTALYEIVPANKTDGVKSPEVDPLKYQKPAPASNVATDEVMTLKLRYKAPDGDVSKLLEFPIKDETKKLGQASADFRFAAAVAGFGMLLRNSEYRGSTTWDGVIELAGVPTSSADQPQETIDEAKLRVEFTDIVRRAKQLAGE